MKKKIQRDDFWHIHFESPIFAFCTELAKLGKAFQEAYSLGGWLILQALLKNGVAEGVTSDPHDTTQGLRKLKRFTLVVAPW